MDKKATQIVNKVETYLRVASNLPLDKRPTSKEIEHHITELFITNSLVSELFSIEVIPVGNTYRIKPRNRYTSIIMGALPMFCKECGRLLEPTQFRGIDENCYLPCSHEFVIDPI